MVDHSRYAIQLSAAQTMGKRKDQQDSCYASRPEIQRDIGVICVVADGMGGLSNGKQASQRVVETMVNTFYCSTINETPEQILLSGCMQAQKEVRSIQQTPGESGSTLVAAIVRDDRCSFLSVGDSRIYLFRGGGLIQLTRDQNRGMRTDLQIALGRLPEEARTDRKRAALTSYLGMEGELKTDRSSNAFPVIPGDRIVLMTEGVYGALCEEDMAEAMALPENQVANAIIDKVAEKDRAAQDNCMVVVIDVSLRDPPGGEV